MKFEECQVGDLVTPEANEIKTCNPHLCSSSISYATSIKEFMITGLNYIAKTVDIAPINSKTTCALTGFGYDFVDPSCLNRADFHKIPMPAMLKDEETIEQPVDFKVISSPSQLSAYYKGKKIAVVDHNNYDDEFELNLLLRRACLKLKDEHTVVETVEELLKGE